MNSPIEHAVQATVEVISGGGPGCGFIVDTSGLVVTARHVVGTDYYSDRTVQVRLWPQKPEERTMQGIVVRSHRQLDLALVWLEEDGPFPAVSIGDCSDLQYAQPVFAIGSPAGQPNTLSRGIVGNPAARCDSIECIQTDAAIDHGNSGGPLIDEAGEALGVVVWGLGGSDAAKFAVPLDYFAEDIEMVLRLGKQACLSLPYCRACGFLDTRETGRRCRNCGIEWPAEAGSA